MHKTAPDLKKQLRPIIHWRNPMLGKFYYLKGLRRKRVTRSPEIKEIKRRLPLEDRPIFKPSSVIGKSNNRKIFYPSEVIPQEKKNLFLNLQAPQKR